MPQTNEWESAYPSNPDLVYRSFVNRDVYVVGATFSELNVEWHRIGAVDWDGVIGVFPHPEDGERPVEGAMRGLHELLKAGWYLEIFSAGASNPARRTRMIDLLRDWSRAYLVENKISLNSFLGLYPDQLNFPVRKPGAKWYLDDRGVKFESWEQFTPEDAESFRAWWQHPKSTH